MAEMMMMKKMQERLAAFVQTVAARWLGPTPTPTANDKVTNLAERRRLKRLKEGSAGCLVSADENVGMEMRLLDISDQGARLVSTARLRVNQRVTCTVATRTRNITFPVQIMWVRGQDDHYEYGARLVRQRGAANVELDMFIACRFVEMSALAG